LPGKRGYWVKIAVIGAAALAAAFGPVPQAADAKSGRFVADAARLLPGQYVWTDAAAEGPVEIVISLPQQLAYVFRSGKLIGASTISSGKVGHESPVGRFQILQKREMHRSNRYSDAPMPYMQRLNWFGVAIHGGAIPGYPASRGCIRLPMEFARKLFAATELGGFVFISPAILRSPKKGLKLARLHASAALPADRMPR
jgi:lipoprotein-anchoring transpeptidase ErfK/SrfK